MFFRRYKIVNLGGFNLSIDISWILIALLIILSLGISYFPVEYPGQKVTTYMWMSALAMLGFFGSIVIHEFFHSLVARLYAMPVKGITLWLLGGIAEMSDEPPSPKAEFLMAGAGPLATVVIGFLCFGLSRIPVVQSLGVVPVGVLKYLWRINLVLAIFNLIPAYPMDGGRILRAALWAWKGKMGWATRVASRIGAGFGAVMMILGLLGLFTGNSLGGVWYFILGLFIRSAALSSYSQLMIMNSLKDVSLRHLMSGEPICVLQTIFVSDLVEEYLYKYQHRMFPVIDGTGKLVGCVKSAAIRHTPRDEWVSKRVSEIMEPSSESNTIDGNADAFSAMKKMASSRNNRLVITIAGDRVLGVVSLSDIMRYVAIKFEFSPDESDGERKSAFPGQIPIENFSKK